MLVSIAAALALASPTQIAQDSPSILIETTPTFGPGFRTEALLSTPDEGLFVLGTRVSPVSPTPAVEIIRTNPDGSVAWSSAVASGLYAGGEIGIGLASDGAGGVYAVTNGRQGGFEEQIVLYRFSGAGDLLVVNLVTDPGAGEISTATRKAVVADGSGGVYIGGSRNDDPATVLVADAVIYHVPFDSSPATVFRVPGPTLREVEAMTATADGGLAVMASDLSNTPYATKLGSGLDVIWQSLINLSSPGISFVSVANIAEATNGDVIVALTAIQTLSPSLDLQRLDAATGSAVWATSVDRDDRFALIQDIEPLSDGGVLVAGLVRTDALPQAALLERYDADGQLILTQLFATDGESTELNLLEPTAGGIYVLGNARVSGLPASPNRPFIARYDDLAEIGQRYCDPAVPNSTGLAGETRAFGSLAAEDGTVVLRSSQLPEGAFGLYVLGSEQGLMPILGGSAGRLCIAGNLGRINDSIGQVAMDGSATYLLDLTALPTAQGPMVALPGDQWNFQYWHRDDPAVSSSNATDAVAVTLK